ncbi:MAG: hypothetical protein MOB07_15795 [Acidobacteria bacterium]|nr:hypothetical protein [Acidobacteriota bacterium]
MKSKIRRSEFEQVSAERAISLRLCGKPQTVNWDLKLTEISLYIFTFCPLPFAF